MKAKDTQRRAFVFRLHPTQAQEEALWQWIGAGRWVYNRCLQVNQEQYEKDKTFIFPQTPRTGLSALLTHQWSKEYPWLKEPLNIILRQRINDFGESLSRVRRGGKGGGFPKFRSRHIESHQTIRFSPWKPDISTAGVKLPKMDRRIRWTRHRPLEGKVKSVTINQRNERWFAVVLCELPAVEFRPPVQ